MLASKGESKFLRKIEVPEKTEAKIESVILRPADEKYLEACQANKHDEWKHRPGAQKYKKNEAAIA